METPQFATFDRGDAATGEPFDLAGRLIDGVADGATLDGCNCTPHVGGRRREAFFDGRHDVLLGKAATAAGPRKRTGRRRLPRLKRGEARWSGCRTCRS